MEKICGQETPPPPPNEAGPVRQWVPLQILTNFGNSSVNGYFLAKDHSIDQLLFTMIKTSIQ